MVVNSAGLIDFFLLIRRAQLGSWGTKRLSPGAKRATYSTGWLHTGDGRIHLFPPPTSIFAPPHFPQRYPQVTGEKSDRDILHTPFEGRSWAARWGVPWGLQEVYYLTFSISMGNRVAANERRPGGRDSARSPPSRVC